MLSMLYSCKLVIPRTNSKNQDSVGGKFGSIQSNPTTTGQSVFANETN